MCLLCEVSFGAGAGARLNLFGTGGGVDSNILDK